MRSNYGFERGPRGIWFTSCLVASLFATGLQAQSVGQPSQGWLTNQGSLIMPGDLPVHLAISLEQSSRA